MSPDYWVGAQMQGFVFKQEEGEVQAHGVTLTLSSHPSPSRVLPGVLGERGREENRGFALPVLQRAQREGGVRWYITTTIVTTRSEGANDSCGRSLSWMAEHITNVTRPSGAPASVEHPVGSGAFAGVCGLGKYLCTTGDVR
jgi:hypothetical protein